MSAPKKTPAQKPKTLPPISDSEREHCLIALKKAVQHATYAYEFCAVRQVDSGYAYWALCSIRQAYNELVCNSDVPMLPPKPEVVGE